MQEDFYDNSWSYYFALCLKMIYDDPSAALSVIQSPGNRLQAYLVLLCLALLCSIDAKFLSTN